MRFEGYFYFTTNRYSRREDGKCLSGRGEMSVGKRENVHPVGGYTLSGKSVSPVSPLEGYLEGVVGESAAKRGYESPASPQGILCGGHGGDSDLHEADISATKPTRSRHKPPRGTRHQHPIPHSKSIPTPDR